MGSASSKENDANPSDLGTNSGAYPMHHHPYYSQATQAYSAGLSGDATGDGGPPFPAQGEADGAFNPKPTSEAMDVDTPPSAGAEFVLDGASAAAIVGEDPASTAGGDDVVPMVFKWEHGGRNVFITGTFNGWSKQCPMHRSGNDFTYVANLTRGKHAYKFVVDDEWRFAPDQLTVTDVEGNVNNFVDVSEFAPLADFVATNPREDDEDTENPYSRYIPEIDEYTKEPPPLPPQLRHIILNKVSSLASALMWWLDARI